MNTEREVTGSQRAKLYKDGIAKEMEREYSSVESRGKSEGRSYRRCDDMYGCKGGPIKCGGPGTGPACA